MQYHKMSRKFIINLFTFYVENSRNVDYNITRCFIPLFSASGTHSNLSISKDSAKTALGPHTHIHTHTHTK